MIDITAESPIRLAEAARLVGPGRADRPTHVSTILRWILSGVRLPDGRTVRLEAIRIGSRWMTSAAAVQRFVVALTPQTEATDTPSPRRSGTAARLEAVGI